MEQDARFLRPVAFRRSVAQEQTAADNQRPLSALVTVPVVLAGAACVLPMAVAAVGVTRLAQGRFRGIGTDSVAAGRALWRAAGAAVDALTSPSAARH